MEACTVSVSQIAGGQSMIAFERSDRFGARPGFRDRSEPAQRGPRADIDAPRSHCCECSAVGYRLERTPMQWETGRRDRVPPPERGRTGGGRCRREPPGELFVVPVRSCKETVLVSAIPRAVGAAPTPACPPPFRGRDPTPSSRSVLQRRSRAPVGCDRKCDRPAFQGKTPEGSVQFNRPAWSQATRRGIDTRWFLSRARWTQRRRSHSTRHASLIEQYRASGRHV